MSSSAFPNVVETVGISFYSFLAPNELACLSLASKHLHKETRKHIFNACMLQLPFSSGGESGDILDVYSGAISTSAKTDFLNHVVESLKSKGMSIASDESGDQAELLSKCSYVRLLDSDGLKVHFALGFKSKVFKSKHLTLLHAKMFMDEYHSSENTEERLVAKRWMYLLASLSNVTVGTWYAIFLLDEETDSTKTPVGAAGILFSNEHGQVIEFVRRMLQAD
ncbi:hypothetical protein HJC23_007654 [Cyclotella cryptica]|uniref:F-box domain-containing protein n=1 Tax=Cyclotella cryptica TaxID=29204 RepID=A0ABD3NQ91_9STRA